MREYGQIVNLLKFINEFCSFTSSGDSKILDMLGKFAKNPTAWDIELAIDREYDVLTFKCWTRDYGSVSICADVDFDEIAKDYDLDNLTYEVCNKGLD